MCVVIDTNLLASVFNKDDARHREFSPIKKWIEKGQGYLIFGGSTYKKELGRVGRIMRLINLMKDVGQALAINDDAVDALEKEVEAKTDGTDCDDQHIIALLGASKCSLLCTGDERSFVFIRNRSLYPKGMPKVKMYTSSRNVDLLVKSDSTSLKNLIS